LENTFNTCLRINERFFNDSLPYGKSLFEEIPENRTCAMASILDNFCACHRGIPFENWTYVKSFGELTVKEINLLLKNNFHMCHELAFEKVISSYMRHISHEKIKDGKNIKVILVQICVTPSNAIFEATIRVKNNTKPVVVGDISLLNKYGNQSHCIQDLLLERYCYCKY
jgi:hypothetical protein